jgi:hypothetical protein
MGVMESKTILPLIGVVLGWGLKSLSDYFISRKEEIRTFRKSTFYILRAYKALFDYERSTSYFRKKKPTVEKFEPLRAKLASLFMENVMTNSETVSSAVEILASVDPPLAARLDNTLKNIIITFRKDMKKISETNEERYAKLIYTHDELIDFTLNDLESVAIKLASKSGWRQKNYVEKWFKERKEGTKEFEESLDEQTEYFKKEVSP